MSRITHLKELLRRCGIDNFLNHACFVETVFSAHINSLNRSMIPIIPTFLLCSLLKMLTKDFTDNQIRGLEPAEGDKSKFLKFWNTSDRNNLLDFYRKYENLSEKRLVNRYIAESEYLRWRSF